MTRNPGAIVALACVFMGTGASAQVSPMGPDVNVPSSGTIDTSAIPNPRPSNPAVARAVALLAAKIGLQALINEFSKETSNHDSAVFALAATPAGKKIRTDHTDSLFTVSETAIKKGGGHAKTFSEANADYFSWDSDHAVTKPEVIKNVAFAGGWARADARIDIEDTLAISARSGPRSTPFDIQLTSDVNMTLSFEESSGMPAIGALSVSNLTTDAYDSEMASSFYAMGDYSAVGIDAAVEFDGAFQTLGMSPQTPDTRFISLLASYGDDGLQFTAVDYLGNDLSSQLSVSTADSADGFSAVTITGQLSTTLSVAYGSNFNLHTETFGADAAMNMPTPGSLFCFGASILCIARRRRAA